MNFKKNFTDPKLHPLVQLGTKENLLEVKQHNTNENLCFI